MTTMTDCCVSNVEDLKKVQIGEVAPDFKATAVMPDGSMKEVKLSDYKGNYVVLFFWPFDFTFVCPTEIVAFSNIVDELKALNVEVLGVSIDSQFTHSAWRNTELKDGGIGQVKFPMIADTTQFITRSYNLQHTSLGCAYRGVFIIDKDQVVRSFTVNDLPLGRSTDEVKRVIEALQYFEENGEVCPANWRKGLKAMKPNAEGVKAYMGEM